MRHESSIFVVSSRLSFAMIMIFLLVAGTALASDYKMTTPIAPGIAVPDKIESSIGTLNLTYGYPKALPSRRSTTTSIVRAPCRLTSWRSRS